MTNVTFEVGLPNTYSYDANGNTPAPAASAGVTCRVEDGKIYNQIYNVDSEAPLKGETAW